MIYEILNIKLKNKLFLIIAFYLVRAFSKHSIQALAEKIVHALQVGSHLTHSLFSQTKKSSQIQVLLDCNLALM